MNFANTLPQCCTIAPPYHPNLIHSAIPRKHPIRIVSRTCQRERLQVLIIGTSECLLSRETEIIIGAQNWWICSIWKRARERASERAISWKYGRTERTEVVAGASRRRICRVGGAKERRRQRPLRWEAWLATREKKTAQKSMGISVTYTVRKPSLAPRCLHRHCSARHGRRCARDEDSSTAPQEIDVFLNLHNTHTIGALQRSWRFTAWRQMIVDREKERWRETRFRNRPIAAHASTHEHHTECSTKRYYIPSDLKVRFF